jgi:hypothetical protein
MWYKSSKGEEIAPEGQRLLLLMRADLRLLAVTSGATTICADFAALDLAPSRLDENAKRF